MTGQQVWRVTIPDNANVSLDGMSSVTNKLEISESVYSPFVYGEWAFSGSSNLFELQHLSVGVKLLFTFVGANGNEISFPLSILSIETGPGLNAENLPYTFYLTLVSPWYFEQIPISKAYKGKNSDIIKAILSTVFPNSFSKTTISESYDNLNVCKYQTLQSPVSFIQERLLPYTIGKEYSSVFFFINSFNEIELIDFEGMKNKTKYVAIDPANTNIIKYNEAINDPAKCPYYIYPLSLVINVNGSEQHKLWEISSPGFVANKRVYPIEKKAIDVPVLPALGLNYKEKAFTPVFASKDKSKITYNYIDDSLDLDEKILTKTLFKYNRDLMKEITIDMVIHSNFIVHVGRLCFLDIHTPNDKETASIFSQDYIISNVSHVLEGNKISTTVSLSTTALSKDNTDNITGFLKT